jgi:hypothetical protein
MKYILYLSLLLIILSCKNSPVGIDSQPEDPTKDSRLIGKWVWNAHETFDTVIFTDTSYYEHMDNYTWRSDWKTVGDSLFRSSGNTQYKVIGPNEFWISHPFFIWIDYRRVGHPKPIDTAWFCPCDTFQHPLIDKMIQLTGAYKMHSAYVIRVGIDTILSPQAQGTMNISQSGLVNQKLIIDDSTSNSIWHITSVSGDTSLLFYMDQTNCYHAKTIWKSDTLSITYGLTFAATSILERDVWVKLH